MFKYDMQEKFEYKGHKFVKTSLGYISHCIRYNCEICDRDVLFYTNGKIETYVSSPQRGWTTYDLSCDEELIKKMLND